MRDTMPILLLLAAASGCSGDDPADTGSPTGPDTDTPTDTGTLPTGDRVFATVVRGTLFTSDLGEAQAAHDAIAGGGEAAARAAGDLSHDALLGTGLLGGNTAESFLGLDRWDDSEAMIGFYSDPAVAEGFAGLFLAPPTVEAFEHRPDWHGWGDLAAGDAAGDYWFVLARGRLAFADPTEAQTAHDGVAAAGEAAVTAVGDVAHAVFLGLEDPQEFLAVDVWTDDAAIEGVYTDPAFAEAFLGLFEGAPTLGVYRSTDWHQW